ncbi:hypothetical protein Tco_0621447, partial [Tanacetum coccineum]
ADIDADIAFAEAATARGKC